MYFSPQPLMPSSISLMHNMLDYHKYRKTGFFAIYCVALMIQDCRSQQECLANLVPVFSDERVMKALFDAIKEVDKKYKEMKQTGSKNLNQTGKDMLEKYDSQTKSNVAAGNKQLKMESEACKEFEEALAIRKSCLQILIVIVEFLSNAIIKNERVVLEAKTKEVKDAHQVQGSASKPGQKQQSIQ